MQDEQGLVTREWEATPPVGISLEAVKAGEVGRFVIAPDGGQVWVPLVGSTPGPQFVNARAHRDLVIGERVVLGP